MIETLNMVALLFLCISIILPQFVTLSWEIFASFSADFCHWNPRRHLTFGRYLDSLFHFCSFADLRNQFIFCLSFNCLYKQIKNFSKQGKTKRKWNSLQWVYMSGSFWMGLEWLPFASVCEMIVIIFPPSLECDDCFAVPSNGNAMVGASFQLQPRNPSTKHMSIWYEI